MKKLNLVWLFIGLLAGSLLLVACGGEATPTPAGSAATTVTAKPSSGNAANGEKLFTEVACVSCHPSAGKVAGVGPKLAGTTRDEDYIRNIIRQGKNPMPGFRAAQITDAQLEDLVAYIKNLK